MYYATPYQSPVGELTLASDGESLVGLWLAGQKYFADTVAGALHARDDLPVFVAAKQWLDAYFAGDQPAIAGLRLAPIGGAFRQSVWKILCEIPYGEVTTYGEIANKMAVQLGKEHMSAQAVGGAVGRNPISIIIPCHRVVGTNGSLTGYAGGIEKKVQLLTHEGVDLSGMFVPKRGTAL